MSTGDERRGRAALEAAEWLITLESGAATGSTKAEFETWLRESPLHIAEYLAASRVRRRLAGFARWESIGDLEGGSLSAATPRNFDPAPGGERLTWNRARAGFLAAISCGLLIAIIIPAYLWSRVPVATDFATRVGEKREVLLSDGSVVRLLPDTRLQVRYRAALREVMLSRGEALFRVAKDAQRPFIVEAGTTSVRAVGTVFSVQRMTGANIVMVQEGKVLVMTSDPMPNSSKRKAQHAVPLLANQRLSIPEGREPGLPQPIAAIPSGDAFDWYSQHIVFTDLPVADVVADFNRRNHTQIRVMDPQLAARHISGSFLDSDPGSFASFLATIAGVAVRGDSEEIVVSSDRDSTAARER